MTAVAKALLSHRYLCTDVTTFRENNETLVKILTYHVVPSQVMAADVAAGEVTTVEGQLSQSPPRVASRSTQPM